MKTAPFNLLYLILLIGIYLLNGWLGFWWVNLIIAFVAGYLMANRPGKIFLLHFLIIFLMWTIVSFYKDQQVNGSVSGFLSSLAGNLPGPLMYIISGLLGGLVTGWAASLGGQLRKIVKS